MSKSRGNVVNPDDILVRIRRRCVPPLRNVHGPAAKMAKPWNTKGVEGVYRFLGRVWRLFVDEQSETEFEQAETDRRGAETRRAAELDQVQRRASKMSPPTPAQLKTLHACIKKVTEDLDGMRFNTAISAMMVFVNEAMTWETKPVSVLRDFSQFARALRAAPRRRTLGEACTRHSAFAHSSLGLRALAEVRPALLVEDTLEIPVQVNGKLRDVIKVPADADNADARSRRESLRKGASRSSTAKRSRKSSSCRRSW